MNAPAESETTITPDAVGSTLTEEVRIGGEGHEESTALGGISGWIHRNRIDTLHKVEQDHEYSQGFNRAVIEFLDAPKGENGSLVKSFQLVIDKHDALLEDDPNAALPKTPKPSRRYDSPAITTHKPTFRLSEEELEEINHIRASRGFAPLTQETEEEQQERETKENQELKERINNNLAVYRYDAPLAEPKLEVGNPELDLVVGWAMELRGVRNTIHDTEVAQEFLKRSGRKVEETPYMKELKKREAKLIKQMNKYMGRDQAKVEKLRQKIPEKHEKAVKRQQRRKSTKYKIKENAKRPFSVAASYSRIAWETARLDWQSLKNLDKSVGHPYRQWAKQTLRNNARQFGVWRRSRRTSDSS